MIVFRGTVKVQFFTDQIATILRLLSVWSMATGKLVAVTSIDDGVHGQRTLHGFGLAVDCDPESNSDSDRAALGIFMRRNLPKVWDVLVESDHVHVEFDTKNG